MDIRTKCVHGNGSNREATGAISIPIYQSATFAHPGVGQSTGYDYSRLQNPTREQVEKTITYLEKGQDTLAFSSGMAAISAMMELFFPKDHLIVSADIYGGTHRLFHNICAKNLITFDFLDTSDLAAIKECIKAETKAIFVETPTNPMMHVADIKAISTLAKEYGILTIVDNTFLTPYFQRPLELGADIVIHSGTKFLGGHNDTLAGFLVVSSQELSDELRFIYKTTGAVLSPFDSWLILRGIKTLSVRLERQEQSALQIAQWLELQPKVMAVHYVGLTNHQGHEMCKSQSSGFGSMISFEVDCENTARQILEKVEIILYAESLGGVETLITYPMLQTHGDIPQLEREEKGITERLLRLSVGIEATEDIILDLMQAIE
jgi:cystathionine beta-lyase/cystathionine gamma-synthase